MQTPAITRILVIDEIPLISLGLQEVFRTIHPDIRVEHLNSVFTALSSRNFKNGDLDLIILGSDEKRSTSNLLLHTTELKQRFSSSLIMVYTDQYDPELIANTIKGTVDACVHKHEPADEIRKAYARLSAGGNYLSSIFDTLYNTYRLNL